jgi:hypothetical protein
LFTAAHSPTLVRENAIPSFFVGGYLLDHGEFAAFLYKPADHREQLDQCY